MQWNLRVHAIGIDPENLAFMRVLRMAGWLWPKKFTHQLLMASSRRRPSKSCSQTPSARAMGTSGCAAPSGACSFICVQGCHTAARLAAAPVLVQAMAAQASAAAHNSAPPRRWRRHWRRDERGGSAANLRSVTPSTCP